MWLIGLVVGVWIGSHFGFSGTLLGGSVGFVIGMLFARVNKAEQEFSLHRRNRGSMQKILGYCGLGCLD